MKLLLLAALVAACSAAKLDRTYLPPDSAKTAGGSPGSIQTPFAGNSFNQGLGGFPKGSFANEFQGVVVDAAAPGTRASDGETGLGAPRLSYGSTNSKVGDAAFRGVAGFKENNNNNDGTVDAGLQADSHQASAVGFIQISNEGHFEAKPERAQAAYDRVANTLRFENEVGPESYNFAFETDNGITAEENGVAVNGVHAQGGYSYTGDDGEVYSVTYIADEGGYQPRGDHLPTPPPIPEEILKSLEQNARDEAAGLVDDGSYDAQKYNTGADYEETDVTQVEQNDRQAPTFGKRPESDASASGTFINQKNQPFDRPSPNEVQGQQDVSISSQDYSNNAYQSTSVPSTANAFSQASQSNRLQPNKFGSRIEYNSQVNNNNQNGIAFGKPNTNILNDHTQSSNGKQSSADINFQSTKTASATNGGEVNPNSVSNFGLKNEYLPPMRSQNRIPQKPATTSQGFNQFSQNFQYASQPKIPTSLSQTPQPLNGFQQETQHYTNLNLQNTNRFSVADEPIQNGNPSSSLNSQRPTSQPSIELTTPLESDVQTSNVRPTSQYGSQSSRLPLSRPHSSTPTRSQSFVKKPESFQAQYHPDEVENVQSTTRPIFSQQKQGPDNAYYYRQPAKPFSAPATPGSKIPSSPSDQFNRITQQSQFNTQYPIPSQQNLPLDSFQSQRQPPRGSTQFPQPPTLAPTASTSSNSGQFQGSTISSQYNGITQASASPFQQQNQGSTRYPKPPTVIPTAPTTPMRGSSQYNRITQATATAFVSGESTSPFNFNSQSSLGTRPTFQSTENKYQSMQSFLQPQAEQESFKNIADKAPMVPIQQYSGEIYEYSKPAEMLPAPAKPESSPSSQNKFVSSQGSRGSQKQQQTRPTFATLPQNEGQPSRPQSSFQTSEDNQDQPSQYSKPQFNLQPRPFKSESQGFQGSKPQNKDRPNCCQSLNSQIAQLESQRATQSSSILSSTQFGAQFPGSEYQGSSHSFAAGRETFSGPRKPPSFDQETGYHY